MAKSPNPVDKHVGSRVRMRRLMLELIQTRLADALSVTFQRVQKYEKGTNRISASRLQQIAHVLCLAGADPFFLRGLAFWEGRQETASLAINCHGIFKPIADPLAA